MLPNPSVEISTVAPFTKPDYWTPYAVTGTSAIPVEYTGGASIYAPTWSPSHASHGWWGLYLPVQGLAWRSSNMVVNASLQYRWRGWTQGKIRCRVIQYIGTGSYNHIIAEADPALTAGAWREFRVDFILDLHTTSIEVQVETIDSTPSAADHMWFGPVINDVVPDALDPEIPVQGMNVSYRPEPPLPPTVASATSSTITLNWLPPPGSEYLEPIVAYEVAKRPHALTGGAFDSVALIPNVLSYTVTGLDYGTTYQFVMTAYTTVGPGNRSAPLVTATTATLPTVPGVPRLYGVAASHELQIEYNAPASDGNSPISGYRVFILDPAVGFYDTGTVFGPSGRAHFYGLDQGMPYNFKVAAINSIGEGPMSASSPSIQTADETETNVTMRFYITPSVINFPYGLGETKNFEDIVSLDIARALEIPKVRVNITRVTRQYISFWIRSGSGTSTKTVKECEYDFMMNVVDKTSVLQNGILTWQTDTHYLLYNNIEPDLAAARRTLGGPGKRLSADMGVLVGTVIFMFVPMFLCFKQMYDERVAKKMVNDAYKLKFVEQLNIS